MTKKHNIEPIIRTKLHRPPVASDHVHRGDLLNRLARQQDRPLTLVSAPAGYGKSTLVSCWLAACDTPGTWVSLDENDNDLRGFLSYLVAAIQDVFPGACGETLSMLGVEQLPEVSVLARTLINELDRFEKSLILVLDDYHRIRDNKVHELLADLLRHPSAVIHLVLIGRRDPPLPLTALRAKGQMLEIRTRDLRFSLEETLAFLQQTTGAPVDGDVAAILEEKTEGWVTGLRLAALSMMDQKDIKCLLAGLPLENRYVMAYFVSEILSQYPLPIQACMLKSAILNRFNAQLCDAVCCPDSTPGGSSMDGRSFLSLLENANLFVVPLDDEQKWFRWHHLFQKMLKRHLKERFTAQEITLLYERAGTWFAENGHVDEALSIALEGDALAVAAEIVERYRQDIMSRGDWYHLNRCLTRFPHEYVQGRPELLLASAWLLHRQARYPELAEVLDRIENFVAAADKASAAGSVLWGELQALRSFQHFIAAQGALAETTAREALTRLPASHCSPRGMALIILAAALQMRGELGGARRVVYAALEQEDASNARNKSMSLAALCFSDWIAADLQHLKQVSAQFLKHGQRNNLTESVAVGRYFAGITHYQQNELDLAQRFLEPVFGELAVPSVINYCHGAFALALTYQAMGREQAARAVSDAVTDFMLEAGNTNLLKLCEAFEVELALRQGHAAEAGVWMRHFISVPFMPAFRFYAPQVTLARLLLARAAPADLSEADRYLARLCDFSRKTHGTGMLIDALVLRARRYALKGNLPEALNTLTEALALAEPGGLIRPFLDQGPEMPDLLNRLVKKNPALRYAGQILEAIGGGESELFGRRAEDRNKPGAASPDKMSTDPLSNREIEVLRMLAKGTRNKNIAESLSISPETVKRHLSTIYRKLDVDNRHQAVIGAKALGIL
ncbi:MAG: LuxR C-terminal-related transcriptional regulator [Pseudomonadota bacterium]